MIKIKYKYKKCFADDFKSETYEKEKEFKTKEEIEEWVKNFDGYDYSFNEYFLLDWSIIND